MPKTMKKHSPLFCAGERVAYQEPNFKPGGTMPANERQIQQVRDVIGMVWTDAENRHWYCMRYSLEWKREAELVLSQ